MGIYSILNGLFGVCLQTDTRAPEIPMGHSVSLNVDSALNVCSIQSMIKDMALCGYVLYAHHTMLWTPAPQLSTQTKGCSLSDVVANAYFSVSVQSWTSSQLLHSLRSTFPLATTRGDAAIGR